MVSVKSSKFLPSIYQTAPNKKFLAATLDQLLSEPSFVKLNGYIGRRFAPMYKAGDSYITEETTERANYQLEPSTVVTNENGEVEFFSSYSDLIQQIGYYGGLTNNHSRLFENEYYTYNGQIDFDKLVNFNDYYWAPNGPTAVEVFSGAVDNEIDFTVTRNTTDSAYNFSGLGNAQNPDIILARGGTYTFNVSQPGFQFWIQTNPGTDGTRNGQPNINTRDVYGVTNNGTETGTVTFMVPQMDAQDRYIDMPLASNIDLATTLPFNAIDNTLLDVVIQNYGGIDGITDLQGKLITFVSGDLSDTNWLENGVYAYKDYGQDPYDNGSLIPDYQRVGIWQINLEDTGEADKVIRLSYVQDIPVESKIYVTSGSTYANVEFYKAQDGDLYRIPLITSTLSELYYNDGTDQQFYGRIRIVSDTSYSIDVVSDILGKDYYTSPNGVVFTNGLKIRFDSLTIPSAYAEKEFYVEGVGTSIKLVADSALVTPELDDAVSTIPYDIYSYDMDNFDQILNGPLYPDYITINRASVDGNGWSRSNRWFHISTLEAAATYNNTTVNYSVIAKAKRPIIEFNPDLRLMNVGRVARTVIDIFDYSDSVPVITDAMKQIEGVADYNETTAYITGDYIFYGNAIYVCISDVVGIDPVGTDAEEYWEQVFSSFTDGMRVVFANDEDPEVKKKVYTVSVLDINGIDKVHLVETGEVLVAYDNVISTSGSNKGILYWFDGSSWIVGQQKTEVNQPPLFDIVDANGNSFSNKDIYANSTFAGSKIFSYTVGTGTNDKVLGFPLSYRYFNNVGDILFTNNYDSDTFLFFNNSIKTTESVNNGLIEKITDNTTVSYINVWTTNKEKSKQYQIFSNTYEGVTPVFYIDVLPEENTSIPYIKVYVNSKRLTTDEFSIIEVGARYGVQVTSDLTLGDSVDILIYSNDVSEVAYYEIPVNLNANSLNETFSSLTLGQFRNHLVALASNSYEVVGQVPGKSNLRDISILDHGGSILQHAAPVVYSSLFLLDKEVNFVDALENARHEYSRFKNRFLENFSAVVNAGLTDDAEAAVSFVISKLNQVKNIESPWYYSDMVPYDENTTVINYEVLDVQIKEYEIDSIFDDTVLSNKAILVYLDGVQLVKGIGYEFSKIHPSVVMLCDIDYDQEIKIVIYHDTDGNYIPETPTKLGLYPKYMPEKFLDNTYQTPIYVIRGHDGSLTPAFNDFRDDMLLELEKRIYNNIKVSYDNVTFDINSIIPGCFRDTGYSVSEYNSILVRGFLSWVSNNKLDYSTNEWFDGNNAWTWVYSDFVDPLNGNALPGFWRGVYQFFFDTDAPHMRPWEMLGFSEMPDWWEDTYGPAPYTGGNLVLWNDLELGKIVSGARAGIDERYARPGLTRIIPVDDSGELKSPEKFAVKEFSSLNANGTFAVGDIGPVETAWRRSSDFPFAVQRAIALMRPSLYFGRLVNLHSYRKNTDLDQYLVSATNRRITPDDIAINGFDGIRNAGYLNWIVDYLTSMGIDAQTKIRSYLNDVSLKLGYRVGGFTDKKYLTVLAEQNSPSSINESIVVPQDDYTIHLHKSTPVDRLVYSAVIIEKVDNGYSVTGYNNSNPFFTIIPSEQTSNKTSITAAGFKANVYKDYQRVKMTVPYGYSFTSRQQVVDFLISYGRYLEAQGFSFDTYDENLSTTRNWELSAREFLTWSQQGWDTGSVLVLSPVLNEISLTTDGSVVDEINNLPAGSKVLDLNFKVIKQTSFSAMRDAEEFSITVSPDITIGLLDISLVQYEHAVIFNNTTSFKDVIYKPELGNRQYRLKVIGNKTGDWVGQIAPPGFIFNSGTVQSWEEETDYLKGSLVQHKGKYYVALNDIIASDLFNIGEWKQIDKDKIKTGLLPNFAYNAKKFEFMYDVDSQLQDQDINKMSNGLIGFRERSYLSDLGIDQTTQTKFYQGYIRDKGTKAAFDALANAEFNNISGNIDYYEEWGFRVGEYGALETRQFMEVQLDDSVFVTDPMTIRFLGTDEATEGGNVVELRKDELYKVSSQYTDSLFINRSDSSIYEDDILTAGYVNLGDITTTIFNINDSDELVDKLDSIVAGNTLWVAKDNSRDWNVYRVDETNIEVVQLDYSLDGLALMTTTTPHKLSENEIFVIKLFDDSYNGFYKVSSVESLTTALIGITATQETDMETVPTVTGTGLLFKLTSVRIDSQSNVIDIVPTNGWKAGDKVWVDADRTVGGWAVYEKKNPWAESSELVLMDETDYESNTGLGRSVVLSDDLLFAAVGHPGKNTVRLFFRTNIGKYINTQNIDAPAGASEFGHAVASADGKLVVGSPASDQVFVYSISESGVFSLIQTITRDSGSRFGQSVALNRDASRVFVGAPDSGDCYAFTLLDNEEQTVTITRTGVGDLGPYDLGFTPYADPVDADYPGVTVSSPATTYTYGVDYTISGSQITFTTAHAMPYDGIYYVAQINYYQEVAVAHKTNELFGYSVATNTDGSVIAVTAIGKNSTVIDGGSAYVYSFDGTALSEFQEIAPTSDVSRSMYGSSVVVNSDGTEVFVGAPNYRSSSFEGGAVFRWVLDTTYSLAQTITNPYDEQNENFGMSVAYDRYNDTLMISGTRADMVNYMTFDEDTLTLDDKATYFTDITKDSGAVFVFNKVNGETAADDIFAFSQQLIGDNINTRDQFGTALSVVNNVSIITAEKHSDSTIGDYVGSIHEFTNESGEAGWVLLRKQEPKVDLRNIYRMFMYNDKSQAIVAHLDFIDPVKGKFLGIAEQELTYKTSFDPANYNTGTLSTVAIDSSFFWGSAQVGRAWLNLSKMKFIDYEQDTLGYRVTNWGAMFPGSTVEVAEWVESLVKPSEYSGEGTPLYANDEAYVVESYLDSLSGLIKNRYYFWVIDKEEAPINTDRRLSTVAIQSIITSPLTQGVPFAAVLREDALTLFSSADLLSADNTILHIDYSLTDVPGLIHNEYELVARGSEEAIIPDRIMNKLIDSLVGEDSDGNTVPDITLKASERYGIGLRPRQTMFVTRLTAVKNLVDYVNRIFAETQIVGNYDLTKLNLADPVPTTGWDYKVANLEERSYLDPSTFTYGYDEILVTPPATPDDSPTTETVHHNGTMILVEMDSDYNGQWTKYEVLADGTSYKFRMIQVQVYDTTDYWTYSNWYASDYDYTVKPTYTVATDPDIGKLTLVAGDIVKVKDHGDGTFIIYRYTSATTREVVGIENGTIQLKASLYAQDTNLIGYDNDNFDTVRYDLNPTDEFRNILNALREDIFVNSMQGSMNDLFFMLLNYILSEQRTIDWAFKTSFISIIHKLRKLEQFPSFINDNQTYYEDYLNEVKPYRTKIRQYIADYEGDDEVYMSATDFDLPAYYDSDFGMWRSPSGEHARDEELINTVSAYEYWKDNHSYYVDYITVEAAGYNFSADPEIVIEGGGGSGATAKAVIDYYTGSLIKVVVLTPGTGYTSTPTVTIKGDGVGAKCYAVLANDTVRSIKTTIKFDRITYESNVTEWAAGSIYAVGDLVKYVDTLYKVTVAHTAGTNITLSNFTTVDAADLESAADRVMAYYSPSAGMIPKDLKQLFAGTEFPGVSIDGTNYARPDDAGSYAAYDEGSDLQNDTDLLDTIIQSDYDDSSLGLRPEDILVDGGAYVDTYHSHAPEELMPGIVYDTLDIQVYTVDPNDPEGNNVGFRISRTMRGYDEFRRIAAANITQLAQDLLITDTEIVVVDASALPKPGISQGNPGVVYINGEKLTYWKIDYDTNTLSQIRRGVHGTGAPAVHAAGTDVVDASIDQIIPGDAANQTWLNVTTNDEYTIVDGNGLLLSNTEQAVFLKASMTKLPWVPGDYDWIDPNSGRYKYDMGPYDETKGFDSYIVG